jgi:hypothetical protein
MFRALTAVVASNVLLITPVFPAAASSADSSAEPTAIDGFASSANQVSYQQPVTYTGELVEGRTRTPVPNEPVQIKLKPANEAQFVPVANGTSGSDGRFAITTTLPSGGYVLAAFAGDTGLAPSQSSPTWGILLHAENVPSRLVLDPAPASVQAGTPVTFSGAMQVQVNGAWQPYQGGALTLKMEPNTSTQPNVLYRRTSAPTAGSA